MSDIFEFAPEEESVNDKVTRFYDVLIVDDDEDVHLVTKAALKNFIFEGQGIHFIEAYSGKEAIEILSKKNNIAVVLLDVVMEEDDSGLMVAKAIREEFHNHLIRIILRTGQPGSAPEKETIINYDINDYKNKSELSATQLFTTMYTALRSYNHLASLKKNKQGLEQIITYSKSLFKPQPMKEFASGVLQQLSSLMQTNGDGALFVYFDSANKNQQFHILASTSKVLEKRIKEELRNSLMDVVAQKKDIVKDNYYIGYFDLNKRSPHLVFLDNINADSLYEDKHLIELFAKNISIAFENVYLHQDLVDIQKELIYSLSDLAEHKSKETAYHIKRVSFASELLAGLVGLTKEKQELIRLAAPMHDVGKIAIPDNILHKPGKLTEDEMLIMKRHSEYGYNVFHNSKHRVLQVAADIALSHHENYDGTGYPNQISGESISIYSRIVALIDVFDALTHKRCYKSEWNIDDTVSFIKENRGKKFDPNLVNIFLENLDRFIELNNEYPDPVESVNQTV